MIKNKKHRVLFLTTILTFFFIPILVLSLNKTNGYTVLNQTLNETEDLDCTQPFISLPFIEYFTSNSESVSCWSVASPITSRVTWKIDSPTADPTNNPNSANILINNDLTQREDAWLISPKVKLTGNQRLRFLYKIADAVQDQPTPSRFAQFNFKVLLSTTGPLEEYFTHELFSVDHFDAYGGDYKEIVVDLKNENNQAFTGDINLAFRVADNRSENCRFIITNVIIEDIPPAQPEPTPINLPYFTDFENESSFAFIHDDTNAWHIGTATNNGGNKALYISDNQGQTNTYTTTKEQVSLTYIPFNLPENITSLYVDFDARVLGEVDKDKLNIYVVLPGNNYIPRVPIRNRLIHRVKQFSPSFHEQSNTFIPVSLEIPVTRNEFPFPFWDVSPHYYLIFEWVNDNTNGEQPPIAIDNLKISYSNCRNTDVFINSITSTTAQISSADLASTYDLIIAMGASNLTLYRNSTPTHAAVTFPYQLENLTPNTIYTIYYRRICGNAGKSVWYRKQFTTEQTPATLPYFEDFEGEDNWFPTNSPPLTQRYNHWIISNVISRTGNKSLHIANDITPNYNYFALLDQWTSTHRDIFIPEDALEIEVSFDYHVGGRMINNLPKDYFKLSYSAMGSNTQTDIGQPYYLNSNGWQTESFVVNVSQWQGRVMRLHFQWFTGLNMPSQPPIAIDNLKIKVTDCLSPTDLQANFINQNTAVELSWTPQGGATQWEVFITEQGQAPPTETSTGILVDNDPVLQVENPIEGRYYTYYVRSRCENRVDGKSIWSIPKTYGYFNTYSCADLQASEVDLPQNENNQYILCGKETHKQTLTIDYAQARKTDDYVIESIPFSPPYPFFGAETTELSAANTWSSVIDLGFDFCFYGQTYNKALLSPNGAITFSIAGTTTNGRYTPNSNTPLVLNQPIPNASTGSEAPYLNAIFGALQAIDTTQAIADYSINYNTYGEYPCRSFVFNLYQVPLAEQDPISVYFEDLQTIQVVLYEGTNSIEIYLKNKPLVIADDGNTNINSLLGMQNSDGTLAHVPYQRNTDQWSTTEEAWRFIPHGESSVDFKWYKDGVVYSTDKEITISVEETVNYTARATYFSCLGDKRVLERVYSFIKDDITLPPLPDFYTCSTTTEDEVAIEIDSHKAAITATLQTIEDFNFEVEYYLDPELTQPLTSDLLVKNSRTVYVKVTNINTKCIKTDSFEVIRQLPIKMTQLEHIEACSQYILPQLKENEAYFSAPQGQGRKFKSGDRYDILGLSTLYIYLENSEHNCISETSFSLLLHPEIEVDYIEDQVVQCKNFILPPLRVNNHYYTESNGQGIELFAGTEITSSTTLYIYAKDDTTDLGCTNEHSFTIQYKDCPIPKGFSPNGDGNNDTFDLTYHQVESIKIYNRNGLEVYRHGKGYTKQWDGKDKSGKVLPAGTYFYILESDGKTKSGWVQLNY
ncbi:T9SS type B sorting domain-containing protein [Myroides fluvii]|uniref:T9SS type B sorting domain-containing protein n=1 Tax=Myroides fluvii TaxID=2572594 RepID=UPI00131E5A2D|nr:gliding motility-associated C-terminal domain-containing protein [Myroides fluvii]